MKRFLVYLRKIKNMDNKKKSYASVFFVLGGILLWAFLSAGILTTGFNRSQIKNGDKQSIDVSSMILTESKNDKKYWEIYGETGSYDSNQKVAVLNNVIGNFYKDNEVSMSFESSQATYNEEKGQIILYNKTFIVIKDGTSLKTDRLVWSGSDKDIIAEGNVIINRNGELIATGERASINSDYNKFKIQGHTVSKIFDKNGKNGTKKRKIF